jgi:hypothetical protein
MSLCKYSLNCYFIAVKRSVVILNVASSITRLSASWSSITGHQSHQIFLALNEVDPSFSMEAAMILPSFGEESIWTRQHNRELARATPASGIDALTGSRRNAAGLAPTARGGSAHLEFEPARLRRVADCADGDTDHLPQDVAAQQSKLTADIATDGHLGSPTESFIHVSKAKSVTGRWNGGPLSRRVGCCARELGC